MEITLTIDGKRVPFRKSGATMLAYKRQTGREFFTDLSAFIGSIKRDKKGNVIVDENGFPEADMSQFDMEYMYDMVHIMACSADRNVPKDLLDWLDEFDDFDIVGIFCQLLPMLNKEMQVDEKNSLTAAGKRRNKATSQPKNSQTR